MFLTQKFALENIYCAPSQDRQYTFSLLKITKNNLPVQRSINIYGTERLLPNTYDRFHVFTIGNIFSKILNLLDKDKNWLRNKWYNVSEDMSLREYIFQIYTDKGILFPRDYIYYSRTDEDGLIIAMKANPEIIRVFPIDSMKYLRVYSNIYYNTLEYDSVVPKIGINCETSIVNNNTDKTVLQNKITQYEANGGKVLIYVNGIYTDNLNLNIPNFSFIELLYDQSIISKEVYPISSLRTFMSEKDQGKLKYLIHREKIVDDIQFDDDIEIYISTTNELVTRGLYYYNHKDYSTRNVTDKDFSVYSNYINHQAQMLTDITTGAIQDKVLVVYTRRSTANRHLVYSSLKLHELYKLPFETEYNVLSNTGYTLNELRAETLENSDYFNLAGINKIQDITKELAYSVLGYNGVTYYNGMTPNFVYNGNVVDVPNLYQSESYAYEYDQNGILTGYFTSTGPAYITSDSSVKTVEFIKGKMPDHHERLYLGTETITLKPNTEYRLLSAGYELTNRITTWEDITGTDRYSLLGNTIHLNESSTRKVKIVYLDQPYVYDTFLDISESVMTFVIRIQEDRGDGISNYPLDTYYTNTEVYLNGYRLTEGIDFDMKFPSISIYSKKYINYSLTSQLVHVRCHGLPLVSKNDINKKEITGFVSHGVLTRNSYYDIRDDRIFSTFIDGKLYDRSSIKFSENDNTIRLTNSLNGLPYTITEPFISIKELTGLDTADSYEKNEEINSKISGLYNIIYPEPEIDLFNTISDHHYLFSPTLSLIIKRLVDGTISSMLYTSPYNDNTISMLLNNSPYKELLELDPVRKTMPDNIIEIHPHLGNDIINVNLHQYRFITNLVRILTSGTSNKINLSGYLTVTTQDVVVNQSDSSIGGIVVI